MVIKLGSLFDGIGGFPLAGVKFGFVPVWASEIEPWPIKVTEKHFPNMKHLGDITKVNGAEIEPVDVITFGSPCQDLSVAGKREGLAGERSGLFSHAVRIIREMRTATGGKYPRFAVWENVPGAFSSNGGEDFRAVLEEIAEAEIPMPRSGKWATAGMVRTERVDIAWRVLDAQYWGVPQRRKRIFLVADFRGQCAGEILFVEEGLSGHFAESGEAGEETAGDVGNGFKAAGFKSEQSADARSIGWQIETAPTLRINCTPEGITGAVSSKWAKGTGGPAGDECYNLVIEPRTQDGVCRIHHDIVPTLNTAQGGQRQPRVITSQPIPIHDKATRYKGGGPTRKNDGAANGFGVGKPGDVMPTLGTGDRHAVAFQPGNLSRQAGAEPSTEVFPTLGATTLGDQFPHVSVGYAVRRLTPTEALRLQGYPDYWLDIEGMSDTAKYKAIGNSVAIPCVMFVLGGIARVLRPEG